MRLLNTEQIMTNDSSPLIVFYDKLILKWPKLVIILLLIVISFLGYHAKDFKLDASAETLVLENDRDLKYSRLIYSRYGEQDYLFLTYTPKKELFSDKSLNTLAKLRDELKQLDFVDSVVSILDVPLLESPPIPINELSTNIITLKSPKVDKKLARIEFKNSPLYQELLVSPDLKTTALQITFPNDKTYQDLLRQRNSFREKSSQVPLSEKEKQCYKKISLDFQEYMNILQEARHRDIMTIRKIMDKYRQDADLFLGGVSMIADDMISFIKKDLCSFGLGVPFFLILALWIIFKKKRWVLLPILSCAFSTISMMGFLGLFNWEVTVVSSNFISLQIILTMAVTIHLIVRYRELASGNPDLDQETLIRNTIHLMFKPCLYAALTTMAGFASLILCDILPVITFGLMMISGIIVSLILTFLLFPSVLMLLPKETIKTKKISSNLALTTMLAKFTEAHGNLIMVLSAIIFIISVIGISRLKVENCFIDYFKKTTEIYQGMKVIDQRLGGTTPMDVIIDLPVVAPLSKPAAPTSGISDDEDDFNDFDEFQEMENDDKYWFTSDKMAQVLKIHDYLDSLKETGKVLSLGMILKIAYKFNDGKPLDNFELALLYSELPDKFRKIILNPYVSIPNNQLRFAIRVRDSDKFLQRNVLIKKIRKDLTGKLGFKEDQVRLSGMLVLYNNMLQSLFDSQILTLGIVLLALFGMFLILFRSVKIALIALFPNFLATGTVLGVMGWLNIPLDMMTITIASISVGIAVDDTIHYIHRFKTELKINGNYIKTVHVCHNSIGHAMYYTSLAIVMGFSILVLSSFIPTIYFGLFTSLAMLIALLAALTLLPQLLIFFKPLKTKDLLTCRKGP